MYAKMIGNQIPNAESAKSGNAGKDDRAGNHFAGRMNREMFLQY